jgi:hypothetical protein
METRDIISQNAQWECSKLINGIFCNILPLPWTWQLGNLYSCDRQLPWMFIFSAQVFVSAKNPPKMTLHGNCP